MRFQIPTDELFVYGVPFGCDVETPAESPPAPGAQVPQQDPAAGGQPPTGAGAPTDDGAAEDDENDEFKGFTAKELRRIAADNAAKAKSAEKDRDSYKTKVDEQERKQRTEEENLRTDLNTANDKIAALKATNAKMAIINAITCDSKYDWHDPQVVAQQFNSDEVTVDDTGKVEGLKKALDRVAKDHGYLLKPKGQPGSNPTGFQPGQGVANPGGSGSDIKELAKSYPALASRM